MGHARMDRRTPETHQKGCRAMPNAGIRGNVDLLIGLPGDTVDSVSTHYALSARPAHLLRCAGLTWLCCPLRHFRMEAEELAHLPTPPALWFRRTPTMSAGNLFMLMEEARGIRCEWDPVPNNRIQEAAG